MRESVDAMNYSVKTLLGLAFLATGLTQAVAHPEGHHHMPCDHMGKMDQEHHSKMMQKHMEEHHKEAGAAKPTESKEEIKAVTPPAAVKPAPKPAAKPAS